MTMTPTERPQNPWECRHFSHWTCMAHGKEHPCVFASELANVLILNCPYCQPKEKKMERNNCKHFSKRGLLGWVITHLNRCDGANDTDSCLYEDGQHLCPKYEPKENKDGK